MSCKEYTGKIEVANKFADMIIYKRMTIREVADKIGVSKTTVHNYISKYTRGKIRVALLRRQLKKNYEEGTKKGLKALIKYSKSKKSNGKD